LDLSRTYPVEVLLIEDSKGDVRLIEETFKDGKILLNLSVANDGVEGMEILRERLIHSDFKPIDLILLDLNLPKKDGREVLAEIRSDPRLRHLPVVVLTSSGAEKDILKAYDLYANCYVVKPIDLDEFIGAIRQIENFWLSVVRLPIHLKNTP
jgi:chemotaxis family two-component system response regulator Rcp1